MKAPWVTIGSSASPRKSTNMISATGRRPAAAAPTAAPAIASSEIGVLRTRSGPNSSSKPTDVLKTPPASATSSPNVTTVGSALISSAIARAIAWFIRILIVPSLSCLQTFVDSGHQRFRPFIGVERRNHLRHHITETYRGLRIREPD
ncbi:hypothetical protein BMS3Bbin02_00208 [bacterium BMS3Bbin02]|nr:hypothetical protein BMS3Bbin02_00208 [bacterium BMS3Bbin02]